MQEVIGSNAFLDLSCYHCFISNYIPGEGQPLSSSHAKLPQRTAWTFSSVSIPPKSTHGTSSCRVFEALQTCTFMVDLSFWLGCSSIFQITFNPVSFFFPFWTWLIFPLGKLEETISNSFAKSANLWAFLLKEGCPSAIRNCSHYFSKLIDPQVHNTLLMDIARFLSLEEEVDEPADITGWITVIVEGPYKALLTP